MLQKQQPKLEQVAPGASLYNPVTKQVEFSAPPKPERKNLSDLVIMGPDGKPTINTVALQARKEIARAGASSSVTKNYQESAFSKTVGEDFAKQYTDLMKSDAMATSKITRFGRLEQLLPKAGTTGRFAPAIKDLASAAQSLGLKVDEKRLGTQEAVEQLSNEMALQLRNPAGGAGMPGAMSDADRNYLNNMVPGLGKTAEGNRMIIQTAMKLAQRERDVAKLAREYKKTKGVFDEEFYQVLADFSEKNPLFPQQAQQAQGGFRIVGEQ
jgi:hypothetical protein